MIRDIGLSFYTRFLTPTFKELGIVCERSTAAPRDIVKGIVDNLFKSEIVLAILTDSNPNVWYELGVRHAIADGTILAIQEDQHVPFDIAHYGVVKYNRHDRETFKKHVRYFVELIRQRDHLDNPVADYFLASPTRLVSMAMNVADTPLSSDHAVEGATHSLFIVGQNLYHLSQNNSNSMGRMLETLTNRPNLRVRIMIADPDRQELACALSLITDDSMSADLQTARLSFLQWREKWLESKPADPSRFEIRGSSRVGNVSFTFLDADTTAGQMLVRPTIYRTPPQQRPCFLLSCRRAPDAFRTYYRVFDEEWNHASEFKAS